MVRSSSIPHFQSIEEYNFKINISPPRYEDFDIRNFEDNMRTVRLRMPPFRVPCFQLAILKSGSGDVSSDGTPYDLNDYTLFFNIPGQIIYWDVQQDWKGYYISLDERFYTVHAENFPRLNDLPYFKTFTQAIRLRKEEAEMMLDIMIKMDDEYRNPTPYNKSVIKSYLNNILTFSIRFYDRQQADNEEINQKSRLSDRFKETVNNRTRKLVLGLTSDAVSIGEIADELFVTAKHLSETVKKELGLTPTEYINNELINEAEKLLRTTDFQIKEIAYQLGFNDPTYFNRLFKKINGNTPARYRLHH